MSGSLLWAVIGLETSVPRWTTEWSLHNPPINAGAARGVLISVLGILAVDPNSTHWRPPVPHMDEDVVRPRTWTARTPPAKWSPGAYDCADPNGQQH